MYGPARPFLPLAPKPVQEENFSLLGTFTTLWLEPFQVNVTEEPEGREVRREGERKERGREGEG